MRVVVALGADGWPAAARALQRTAAIRTTAEALAGVAQDHDLVVTLGRGPQDERLAGQGHAHADMAGQTPAPSAAADEADAAAQLARMLAELLGPARPVQVVAPRVEVDRADPAFGHPRHAVGPLYTQDQAQRLAASHQWSTAPCGAGYRRVVASATPRQVLGLAPIENLLADHAVVLVCGNGGIPLAPLTETRPALELDAVVDPGLFSALLAHALGAGCLLLVGSGDQTAAARQYLHTGGHHAAIGTQDQLAALLDGSVGIQLRAAVETDA